MAKRRKPKYVERPTARPKTERVAVSSPTVPGAREEVEFVPGHVDRMYARRQFGRNKSENEFAFRAADRLRRAYEMLHGAVGGVMDFDRARGSGGAPVGPHVGYLQAAETMRQAKQLLYPLDYTVISFCVMEGHTIENTTMIIRGSSQRHDREEIGRCLRSGLQRLAEHWFGSAGGLVTSRPLRAWADPKNEMTPIAPGVIDRGNVYVAGRDK